MISLSLLLQKAQAAFPQKVSLKYSHPNLYLLCVADEFGELTEEARMDRFAKQLSLQPGEIAEVLATGTLQLNLITEDERRTDYDFLDNSQSGHHWMEYLTNNPSKPSRFLNPPSRPASVHFYGFKGGQGRSSILALLAKQMADDGYRILAVDADFEAPSLDILLGASAPTQHGTLLDFDGSSDQFHPISAYIPRAGLGIVDLIPCRPKGNLYDLDFAAFALRSCLDVVLPEKVAGAILRAATAQNYDLILFDHRSGLSCSILPIMSACPGPVAICLRLDEQSNAAAGFFDVLLRQNADYPGCFVSFSLDPEDTLEKMCTRGRTQIDSMLEMLGKALAVGASSQETLGQLELPLTPDELSDYWVPWFHDRALLNTRLPNPSGLLKANIASLQQIRTLIGYAAKKDARPSTYQSSTPALSGSGGTDEGLFIETEALRKLLPVNTSYTYIFGRKGTGKTRLLRELAVRKLGEPLVVAADFRDQSGIPSSDQVFKDLSDSLVSDPEKFWWAILASTLELPVFPTRDMSLNSLRRIYQRVQTEGANAIRTADIVALAGRQPSRRVFLIDGVETAFLSSRLLSFLEGLFKFLLSLQNTPKLQDQFTVRLFLRTDLARRAFQNIEQQISGRVIYLSWDKQSILNFVLYRMSALPWFIEEFPIPIASIRNAEKSVLSGNLPEDEADDLLSQIFPQKIRRNNLLTLTFLKTYFSDSVGETATYYPRIYDRFLQLIDNPTDLGRQFTNAPKLEDNRVSQALIFAAHEQASKDYLGQVEAELVYLLLLAEDYQENCDQVKQLLQAFAGLKTPFKVDECVQKLCSKLQGISEPKVRAALVQMRDVGIFEERPGYPDELRVGRLFKASLGMKYFR